MKDIMQKLLGRNLKKIVGNGRFVFLLAAILFVFMASACAGLPSSASSDGEELNTAALYSSEVEEVALDSTEDLTLADAELEADSVLEEIETDEVLTVKNIASATTGSIIGWIVKFLSYGRFWAG